MLPVILLLGKKRKKEKKKIKKPREALGVKFLDGIRIMIIKGIASLACGTTEFL
jgi:hypothetical protein